MHRTAFTSFTYDELLTHFAHGNQALATERFKATSENGFYVLNHIFPGQHEEGYGVGLGNALGWKFHIAVDDRIEGNVAKAWDEISKILIEENTASCKVITPNTNCTDGTITQGIGSNGEYYAIDPRGKQFTIYAPSDHRYQDADFWENLLQKIENRLVARGVIPDPIMANQDANILRVRGSLYTWYRCDAKLQGERQCQNEHIDDPYLFIENRTTDPNPSNVPNIYETLAIQSPSFCSRWCTEPCRTACYFMANLVNSTAAYFFSSEQTPQETTNTTPLLFNHTIETPLTAAQPRLDEPTIPVDSPTYHPPPTHSATEMFHALDDTITGEAYTQTSEEQKSSKQSL